MLHRSDAARACLAAADDVTPTARCFNVVGGIFTVEEIASEIATALNVPLRGFRVPGSLVSVATVLMRLLPGPTSRTAASIERWRSDEAYSALALEKAYGFRPCISLSAGLQEEIDWYLQGATPAA
jgi:nucleoside-diphosphate-sugar epimerase